MPAPDLMFEHGLDVKKGWFDMASLDYSAKLKSTVSYDVPRGRVVHLQKESGKDVFAPGVSTTGVAIFLLNGSADADVSNPGTTASGAFMHQAVSPSGKLSGLVATGGYEIATTEYVKTSGNPAVAVVYSPGDLLTAPTTGGSTVEGVLTKASAVQYVNPVCGVVSSGAAKNHNGVDTLSFWCVYLPAGTAATINA
jgi:hypothetical protein